MKMEVEHFNFEYLQEILQFTTFHKEDTLLTSKLIIL